MELLPNVSHRTMHAIEMRFKKREKKEERKKGNKLAVPRGFFVSDSCFQEWFPASKM